MFQSYLIYGQTLRTSEDFQQLLPRTDAPEDLCYRLIRHSMPEELTFTDRSYRSQFVSPTGTPRLEIWRQLGLYRARLSDAAVYDLTPNSITCYPFPDVPRERLEILLLGSVLSWWLELRGIPTLHAAASVVQDNAIAFLSTNRGGKSTLAATLAQAGFPVLTDDILALDWREAQPVGHPGYPQMRMWPAEAQHFLGHYKSLKKVHSSITKRRVPIGPETFGTFCTHSKPVARIYLPERRDPAEWGHRIEITPVPSRIAVIELIRNSFSAQVAHSLGLAQQRLDHFSRLVKQVPVHRLIYPSGLNHLPCVRQAILADLAES